MQNNIPVNSSLDLQIQEARKRAEEYAQSLKQAREQENNALKTLELEREKWTKSIEEKSLLVNQLERELRSTVDTLEFQRRFLPFNMPSTQESVKLVTEEVIMEELKKRLKLVPPKLDKSFTQLPTSTSNSDQNQLWNELLNQYKDQLQKARFDLSEMIRANEKLTLQVSELSDKLNVVNDYKEQLKIALNDTEGKLQFRTSQVREYEEEKITKEEDFTKLREQITLYQKQVEDLNSKINILEEENKGYVVTINELHQNLHEIPAQPNDEISRLTTLLQEKEFKLEELEKQTNENAIKYSSELAEAKKMINSLQLRLKASLSPSPAQYESSNAFLETMHVPAALFDATLDLSALKAPIIPVDTSSSSPDKLTSSFKLQPETLSPPVLEAAINQNDLKRTSSDLAFTPSSQSQMNTKTKKKVKSNTKVPREESTSSITKSRSKSIEPLNKKNSKVINNSSLTRKSFDSNISQTKTPVPIKNVINKKELIESKGKNISLINQHKVESKASEVKKASKISSNNNVTKSDSFLNDGKSPVIQVVINGDTMKSIDFQDQQHLTDLSLASLSDNEEELKNTQVPKKLSTPVSVLKKKNTSKISTPLPPTIPGSNKAHSTIKKSASSQNTRKPAAISASTMTKRSSTPTSQHSKR